MSAAPRRILVVSRALPSPVMGGFHIRAFHLLKHLARRHAVSVIAYAGSDDSERLPPLLDLCVSVQTVPHPAGAGARKRMVQAATAFSRWSYQSMNAHSAALQRTIDSTVKAQAIELIQVESSQMAARLRQGHAALVVDEHNVEFELLKRSVETETDPVRRLFNRLEYAKFRREEIRLWQRTDGCIVTSEREAAIVRSLAPDTPLVSVPNGVDAGYFAPQADTLPDPASIVFSANLGYRPNVDAALYFVREIFPLILRQCPEAIFTIVGTGAPAEIQQLASRRIIITGRVPDVRPFIAKAAVFVVPIRYGSGTRLKVLEALAMRMPVVSTSLGAEGIPVLDGRHLLLADDPEPFATSVLRLLEDRSLARTLATCGRDMVLQKFRWEHLARRLDVLHGQALERAAARDHHA